MLPRGTWSNKLRSGRLWEIPHRSEFLTFGESSALFPHREILPGIWHRSVSPRAPTWGCTPQNGIHLVTMPFSQWGSLVSNRFRNAHDILTFCGLRLAYGFTYGARSWRYTVMLIWEDGSGSTRFHILRPRR